MIKKITCPYTFISHTFVTNYNFLVKRCFYLSNNLFQTIIMIIVKVCIIVSPLFKDAIIKACN